MAHGRGAHATKMRDTLFSIAISLLVAQAAFATPAATRPTSAPTTRPTDLVESLIRDLGADDWRARQSAQDQLVTMGPDVLERLRRAGKEAADDETRRRAEAAAAQIAENALIGPSVITMRLSDA